LAVENNMVVGDIVGFSRSKANAIPKNKNIPTPLSWE